MMPRGLSFGEGSLTDPEGTGVRVQPGAGGGEMSEAGNQGTGKGRPTSHGDSGVHEGTEGNDLVLRTEDTQQGLGKAAGTPAHDRKPAITTRLGREIAPNPRSFQTGSELRLPFPASPGLYLTSHIYYLIGVSLSVSFLLISQSHTQICCVLHYPDQCQLG